MGVWSGKAFFAKVTASEGKYLTSSATYRGAFSTQEVDLCVQKVQATQSEDFVEWIPNNIKSSVVLYPGKEYALSCTFVANTTALKSMFQRLSAQFTALYKRKAFLHWYKGEGMDEMEFQEADKNVIDPSPSTRTSRTPPPEETRAPTPTTSKSVDPRGLLAWGTCNRGSA